MAPAAKPAAAWWKDLFAPLLFGAVHEPLGDAAHFEINGTRIAITADSFVVKPLRFPGGSIGELAVNGTVNDLAVSGARRGSAGRDLRARSRACRRGAGSRSSRHGAGRRAGRSRHRRRRHQSRRARQSRPHVHHDGGYRPADSGSRRSPRDRFARATKCCSAGRSAITASRFCWRAANSISKPISAPIRGRCLPLVEALAAAAGAGSSLDARSHARRRRHFAE